jgi:hypothetical protein
LEVGWKTNLKYSIVDSDMLEVGYHGSRTNSSPTFLEAVSSAVCIIEVGKGNEYCHPAPVHFIPDLQVGAFVILRSTSVINHPRNSEAMLSCISIPSFKFASSQILGLLRDAFPLFYPIFLISRVSSIIEVPLSHGNVLLIITGV